MTLLLQVLGVSIAFSVIMLACGLLVTAGVRLLHALANQRARTLGEMVGAVISGYRRKIGDRVEAGDEQELAFVIDVLTHPLKRAEARLELDPARITSSKAASLEAAVATQGAQLAQADLVTVVRALAVQGRLPTRWFRSAAAGSYSLPDFVDYIVTTFATSERQTTEQFRRDAARLSVVLSCILVVVANLDTVELTRVLWQGSAARDTLMTMAPALLEMEERTPDLNEAQGAGLADERGKLIDGLDEDLMQLNSVLSLADLNLGWQHSRIVRVFCVYRGLCDESGGPAAALTERNARAGSVSTLLWEMVRWLFGLGLSAWLVALGAPFWADVLRTVLSRAQNRVPRPSQPQADSSARSDGT